jgi:hypothetical protein
MRIHIDEDSTNAEASTTGRIVEIEEGDEVGTCFICDRSETSKSSNGDEDDSVVRYCSQQHKEMHHPEDEDNPFPFGVRQKENLGR